MVFFPEKHFGKSSFVPAHYKHSLPDTTGFEPYSNIIADPIHSLVKNDLHVIKLFKIIYHQSKETLFSLWCHFITSQTSKPFTSGNGNEKRFSDTLNRHLKSPQEHTNENK